MRGAILLLIGALVPTCLWLALWQFDRAEQAQVRTSQAQQRGELPPVRIRGPFVGDEGLVLRRARVSGRFERSGRILLDGRKQDGRVGYHLIEPLQVKGSGLRILVNRGWVAEPPPPRDAGAEVEVSGVLVRAPLPALKLGVGEESGWGEVWPYLDPAAVAAREGYPVAPLLLLSDPRLAREAQAAATAAADKRPMHLGYAGQWLVFAALAALLLLVLVRRGGDEA